jgi:cobalt/nickel transport system permease protein
LRELYRSNRSALHALDARVKIVFTLAFIVSVSLTPPAAWPAYILFYALVLSAAILSRAGLVWVFKRSLLALPFALAAAPLVFSGPAPFHTLALWPGVSLEISLAGAARFAGIALKSWISMQAALLLAAVTRFPDLLVALKQLKLPRLFVAIIGMMWRYLFVISEEALRLVRARASRSAALPGRRSGGRFTWRARVTGGMAGSLLLRSLERSDRVYAAMLSRGYNGEPPALDSRPLTGSDRAALVLGLAAVVLVLLLGLLFGG